MRTHLGSNHAPDVTTENGHNTINLAICTADLLVFVIIIILGYQPCVYSGRMLTVAPDQSQSECIHPQNDRLLTLNCSDG